MEKQGEVPVRLTMQYVYLKAYETSTLNRNRLQSNFNGSNTFGTMKISSRQW